MHLLTDAERDAARPAQGVFIPNTGSRFAANQLVARFAAVFNSVSIPKVSSDSVPFPGNAWIPASKAPVTRVVVAVRVVGCPSRRGTRPHQQQKGERKYNCTAFPHDYRTVEETVDLANNTALNINSDTPCLCGDHNYIMGIATEHRRRKQ